MEDYRLETSIGPIEIRPQGIDSSETFHRLFVDLAPKAIDGPGYSTLTIRGIAYRGSMHLCQHSSGLFHVGPEWVITKDQFTGEERKRQPSAYDNRHNVSLTRPGLGYGKDQASDSARAYCIKVIEQAVNEWVRPRAYLLDWAEKERLESNLSSAYNKMLEAEKALAVAKAEWVKVSEKLTAIEAKISQLEVSK